jgi:hypothetical protein
VFLELSQEILDRALALLAADVVDRSELITESGHGGRFLKAIPDLDPDLIEAEIDAAGHVKDHGLTVEIAGDDAFRDAYRDIRTQRVLGFVSDLSLRHVPPVLLGS